jgi:hypothetical protein
MTFWFAVLGYSLFFVSEKTAEFARASYRLVEPPPLASLDPRIVEIVTLGFKGVYDDFLSIWSIQFLVDEKVKAQTAEEVFRSIKATTRQRPKIESIYLLSCFVLTFDLKRPDLCKDIIIDGMSALPDSWRIPVTMGFTYAYRMNDNENAAIFYALAASRPGAPKYFGSLARKLADKSSLTVEDLQGSLQEIFRGGEDGSRMGEFMNDMMQKKKEQEGASGTY